MANRTWNNHNHDWDPMRDDYNDSTFEPQYPDDNAGGGVHLDHCRLYVTNIPKILNEEGLRTAFAKYGTLTEAFLSKDTLKRYGLISYETPGEAKLAMMKLNRTEPLKLNVNIAHKKKQVGKTRDTKERNCNQYSRDDSVSVGSRGRNSQKQEDTLNGEGEMEHLVVDDDLGLMDSMDPELHMELVQLKMEQLKLQEEQLQCKQRMLLLNRAGRKPIALGSSNRCILPDGKIVVRNINDRASEASETDGFGISGGDSVDNPAQLKIPALQRVSSRACVSCGGAADAYCARCGVTPYCGPRCQRRDWLHRHRAVCHNLARLANGEGPETTATPAPEASVVEPVVPPVAPLRRPYSPAGQNVKRKQKSEEDTDDRQQKRFFPPGTYTRPGQQNSNRGRQGFYNRGNRPQDNKSQDNRPQHSRTQYNTPTRKPQTQQVTETAEEEWDISGQQQTEQQTEQVEPKKSSPTAVKQSPVKQSPVKQNTQAVKPTTAEVKPATVEVKTVELENSKEETKKAVKPATLDEVTPARKIVPKKCVVELLSPGDIVMLSVDNKASECRSISRGFVCLSLHENYESEYQALCDAYTADCEADTIKYTPNPGESFSYLNPEEGAWYRARCLNSTLAALIDSSKLVTLTPKDNLKRLSEKYANIPEFCCQLEADKVQMGNNLKCTIMTKTTEVCKVSIENAETGAVIGEGEVSRWLPEVDYPAPAATPVAASPAIPEVPRPDVENNSKVLLVEMTELKRAFVRSADVASQRRYDSVLHGVVLYGQEATPLKEPPQKGQVVVAKFTDGLHYRALCKRTNVKQNKYLLEYIEFGNIEIATLENIYPCPAEFNLSAHPAEASIVSLQSDVTVLTGPATEYIEKLKDSVTELLLTICNDAKTAPSGAEVKLTVADTKESVNGKIEELCTPEWKKLEKSGGDVVEAPTLMYSDLKYLELPETGCEIEVLDISSLEGATVSGYMKGEPLAKKILEDLPIQMEAYCNSDIGREPYLPKFEELCIAQCPPYPQWFRAVLCEQVSGAGGDVARVCYVDYGNVDAVGVDVLRKMLPDFVKDLPALAAHLEIRDFPKDPTQEMLARAVEYMKINDEGRGFLQVSRCEKVEQGFYIVDAPGLIAAMKG